MTILADEDSPVCVTEDEGVLRSNVLAACKALAPKVNSCVDHHFVNVDDEQVTILTEDEDMPREPLNSL